MISHFEMFTPEYNEQQRQWLLARRESKSGILAAGGELASLHSFNDIVRIDFALKRIDEGQYGLCTSCGSPIEEPHLHFMPETPFCSECQKITEGNH